MLTGRWWGPWVQQALTRSVGLILSRPPLGREEACHLHLRKQQHSRAFTSFGLPGSPFNHADKSPRRRRRGGERIDKAWPPINFQRPTPFVQLPDGKVQHLGLPPPWYGSISSFLSYSSVCQISGQLDL